MTGFFLPWNENRTMKKGEKKLHLPKGTFALEDAVLLLRYQRNSRCLGLASCTARRQILFSCFQSGIIVAQTPAA